MLRKLLLASVGAVVLAGSAVAADLPSRAPPPVYLPPAPIFTWTGVYIGGQIGYAWGNQKYYYAHPLGSFGDYSYNSNGVIGGAHVGYNLQLAQWVLGLEGDVDGQSNSKSYTNSVYHPFYGNFNTSLSTKASIQGSIRGRVGIAFDRVLIYGTGGVAFGGFNGTFNTNFPIFAGYYGGYDSVSTTRVGWTAGGGIEYAVTNNWSVRAEYRYTDFGRSTYYPINSFGFAPGSYVNRHFTENRVQVGFSYKFDTYRPAPVVAKY
jgi:outer membrane immunogenic protein